MVAVCLVHAMREGAECLFLTLFHRSKRLAKTATLGRIPEIESPDGKVLGAVRTLSEAAEEGDS